MAVDSTPERSFSVLFSSSRAAEATTGWTCGASLLPRWLVVIIARSVALDRPLRIGQEGRDAGERLVLLGIENMQDGADQQRVAGLLPVVAAFQRAFGIDQDVGDVLDVAHLMLAAAHLEQRIVGGRRGIGRIEQQHVAEAARASRRSAASSRP